MYSLSTPLINISGIGPQRVKALAKKDIQTVKDLLLFIPLRYEDRSQYKKIQDIWTKDSLFTNETPKQFTIKAEVQDKKNIYRKKGKPMQRATLVDESGQMQATWFNNPYILKKLKQSKTYLFSGNVKKFGNKLFITQPVVEDLKNDTIHTGRLVPVYSEIPSIPKLTLRRIFKHIVDNLPKIHDELLQQSDNITIQPLSKALSQIHFPNSKEDIIQARERIALEELIALIQYSHTVKKQWKQKKSDIQVQKHDSLIPDTIPFKLTQAQKKSLSEIMEDMEKTTPMNRLLIGDVGSGKTVVAGCAINQVIQTGFHACLIAPTQILAKQHYKTFQKLFPNLKIQLITAEKKRKTNVKYQTPTLFIGTHSILHRIEKIKEYTPIGLMVYDEQHRFGVMQRSVTQKLEKQPHMLTMTATPIPRSLMLTIFSHLQVSVIDEMPANRIPTKTWIIPEKKKDDMHTWIYDQIKKEKSQVLIICPFISQSESEQFEHVASVEETFENIQKIFKPKGIRVAQLHSQLTNKDTVIKNMFEKKIDILVATPMVEVGVDLPQASIMIIESSERFGLSSLHQLRGRVGRAGQQGYCLLFTSINESESLQRLKAFEKINNGLKLAQMDLQNRGAGNIFGIEQHGFDQLRFTSWTNIELITKAKKIVEHLEKENSTYQPYIEVHAKDTQTPLGN